MYVTYIESTPERVWDALTDPDLSARYWGHSNVSGTGARLALGASCGSTAAESSDGGGQVVVSDPPRALVPTWEPSRVAFEIEPDGDIVRLTVNHDGSRRRGGARRRGGRLGRGAVEPQVAARDGTPATAGAVGDDPVPLSIASATRDSASAHARAYSSRHASPATSAIAAISVSPTTA